MQGCGLTTHIKVTFDLIGFDMTILLGSTCTNFRQR